MKRKLLRIGFCMFLTVALLFCYQRHQTMHKPAFVFAEEEKSIYLTFDDGPSDSTTPLILDTLTKETCTPLFS